MKLKVLINMHYMEVGGAEAALIGLLQSISPERADVDLLLNDARGEFMKHIPEWINVIQAPKAYSMIERPMKEAVAKGCFGVVLGRLLAKAAFTGYKLRRKPKNGTAIYGYIGKYVTPFLPSLKHLGEYDVAISWLAPHNIVLKKITAKRKICWVHTDYANVDVNIKTERPVWEGYDSVVSISPMVTKSFLGVFPSLKGRISEIESPLSAEFITAHSNDSEAMEMKTTNGVVKLLTIGRFSRAKRIDEIPLMAKSLKADGIDFRWFIIGYGNKDFEQRLKENIIENGVEREVIVLGKKSIPYSYIKACDLYVQPSLFEGCSVTVREAQILGKPVVIANYPTADSQVNDKIDGFIGSYYTSEFASDLSKIIKDESGREKVADNLKKSDHTGRDSVSKFYSLIEGMR